MTESEMITFYDRLCAILTEYEEDDGSGDAGDAGERLYCNLVDIVNDMAKMIN